VAVAGLHILRKVNSLSVCLLLVQKRGDLLDLLAVPQVVVLPAI